MCAKLLHEKLRCPVTYVEKTTFGVAFHETFFYLLYTDHETYRLFKKFYKHT
jgi:hypothetical protein